MTVSRDGSDSSESSENRECSESSDISDSNDICDSSDSSDCSDSSDFLLFFVIKLKSKNQNLKLLQNSNCDKTQTLIL